MKLHMLHEIMRSPVVPISVNLVGLGGNGICMLQNLVKIHLTLKHLEHPGLAIMAYDHDKVEDHNIGRQMFSMAEIGMNKATALVQRYYANYGNEVLLQDVPESYTGQKAANITITCTDNIKSRVEIGKHLKAFKYNPLGDVQAQCLYWLDLGNSKSSGQVVLGTVNSKYEREKKEKGRIYDLKDVLQVFSNFQSIQDDDTPSCSLIQSLSRQDLFINPMISTYGGHLLWSLLKDEYVRYQGVFINLDIMKITTLNL